MAVLLRSAFVLNYVLSDEYGMEAANCLQPTFTMAVALLKLSELLSSALVGSQFPHRALSWQTRGLANSNASSRFVHVSPPADARHDGLQHNTRSLTG